MQNINTIPLYYETRRNETNKREKKCSWCYNGCKNKKVYTSHYMKNHKGEITCPKLLKAICRNCGKTGHVMGKFCLEAQKPRCDLLPEPHRRFYIDRCDDSYTPGDSDYFPLSSDDETEDEKNTNELCAIADKYHPQIRSIATTNATPEMMQSMRNFLRPSGEPAPAKSIVVPPPPTQQTWASKLFAKSK